MTKPKASGFTRRRHTNSKLGCLNCKRKKIRCDENLPQCNNCVKGKTDSCSYLSLSKQEITKIKLTHSLRDSQNKLLCQDYRLPTSKKAYKLEPHYEALDFKFELKSLPIRIPSIMYPPLHYNHTTIYDFSNEFKVIEDDEEDKSDSVERPNSRTETSSVVSTPAVNRGLPGAASGPFFFRRVVSKPDSAPKLAHSQYANASKDSVVTDLLASVHRECSSDRAYNTDFFLDILVCLGSNIILSQLKHLVKSSVYHQQQYSPAFLDSLEKHSFEIHSSGVLQLKIRLSKYYAICDKPRSTEGDKYVNRMAPVLYYCNRMLCYCTVLMKFSMESYNKINSSNCQVIGHYLKYGVEPSKQMQSITKNAKLDLVSLKIPSYEPRFVFEVLHNLESLKHVYQSIAPSDEPSSSDLMALKSQYQALVQFVTDSLVPVIYKERKDDGPLAYGSSTIFDIVCRWSAVLPSQAIAYFPKHTSNSGDASYYTGLATTLYSYYYCVSYSLMSIFPEMSYLFNLNFVSSCSQFYNDQSLIIHPKTSPQYLEQYDMDINDLLKRHTFYALRVFSFMNRRTQIFYKNSHFNGTKFLLTKFSINETPISSFNTTLIRPNHLPSASHQVSDDIVFERVDESMTLNIYARNIETLNFFSKACHLQLDPETLLLLRDYRPFTHTPVLENMVVTEEDVAAYSYDKQTLFSTYR